MRTLAIVTALALLVVPVSGTAIAGITGVKQAAAHNRLKNQINQEREASKRFDASMSTGEQDFAGPAKAGSKAKTPARGK